MDSVRMHGRLGGESRRRDRGGWFAGTQAKQSASTFDAHCSSSYTLVALHSSQFLRAYILYILLAFNIWTQLTTGNGELMLSQTRRTLHRELECHPP